MFSMEEKMKIAKKIEELLLGFNHPEMPKKNPVFKLHVQGKEDWSWADIEPNWKYNKSNPPSINSHNENQSTL